MDLKEACDILLPPDVFITHWGKLAKGLAWYGKPGQFDTIEGAVNDIDHEVAHHHRGLPGIAWFRSAVHR